MLECGTARAAGAIVTTLIDSSGRLYIAVGAARGEGRTPVRLWAAEENAGWAPAPAGRPRLFSPLSTVSCRGVLGVRRLPRSKQGRSTPAKSGPGFCTGAHATFVCRFLFVCCRGGWLPVSLRWPSVPSLGLGTLGQLIDNVTVCPYVGFDDGKLASQVHYQRY
ncbi:hypothetical protein E2C01_058562 [Portunus trituberculatus]|uniref:Uncharacterized protein n=1 Tax=Portunus trituberculatus TaxID=210409 RepID=A0A5B7H4A1_PORTR|nr:hypothetical protein [Portunus trituberculatus]